MIFYYGKECPHCHTMMPLIDRLEEELGLTFERKETWHDQKNALDFARDSEDGELCGGVPFVVNTETGKHICGAVDYEKLKSWALGQGVK